LKFSVTPQVGPRPRLASARMAPAGKARVASAGERDHPPKTWGRLPREGRRGPPPHPQRRTPPGESAHGLTGLDARPWAALCAVVEAMPDPSTHSGRQLTQAEWGFLRARPFELGNFLRYVFCCRPDIVGKLTGNDLKTLVGLLLYANHQGGAAWPSQGTVAWHMDRASDSGERMVRAALSRLRDVGLVAFLPKRRGPRGAWHCAYKVLLPPGDSSGADPRLRPGTSGGGGIPPQGRIGESQKADSAVRLTHSEYTENTPPHSAQNAVGREGEGGQGGPPNTLTPDDVARLEGLTATDQQLAEAGRGYRRMLAGPPLSVIDLPQSGRWALRNQTRDGVRSLLAVNSEADECEIASARDLGVFQLASAGGRAEREHEQEHAP